MRVDYLTSAIQKSYCSSFEEFWPLWHKPQFNKPWNIKATSRFRKPSEAYTINFIRVLSIVEKCLEHHEGSRKLYFFIVRAAGLHVDVISFLIKKKPLSVEKFLSQRRSILKRNHAAIVIVEVLTLTFFHSESIPNCQWLHNRDEGVH